MKAYKSKTWQFETMGYENYTHLFGVDIFRYDWIDTGERVKIVNPGSRREERFNVYKVLIDGKEYEFAAGEFSMSRWGFFLKKY